jgi:hypothetical protein
MNFLSLLCNKISRMAGDTHACNPSIWKAEVGGVLVQASLGCIVRPLVSKKKKI